MTSRPPSDQIPPPDDVHRHDWEDVLRRRDKHGRWFRRQQPKSVADVLAQLVQRKGYAQLQAAGDLDDAWKTAVGAPFARQTRVGAIRRGVLEVTVANSLLVQELGFEKERLLAALKLKLPEAGIEQLRFRVGPTT